MSSKHPVKLPQTMYIETPRGKCRPEKISSVLEKRMKAFARKRRRHVRREAGHEL